MLLWLLPICRLHEVVIFEKYLEDWTILYHQEDVQERDMDKSRLQYNRLAKVILGPCPAHHLRSSSLNIFHDKAEHSAFRILKLPGNQVNRATICLISSNFIYSHLPFFIWLRNITGNLLFLPRHNARGCEVPFIEEMVEREFN